MSELSNNLELKPMRSSLKKSSFNGGNNDTRKSSLKEKASGLTLGSTSFDLALAEM